MLARVDCMFVFLLHVWPKHAKVALGKIKTSKCKSSHAKTVHTQLCLFGYSVIPVFSFYCSCTWTHRRTEGVSKSGLWLCRQWNGSAYGRVGPEGMLECSIYMQKCYMIYLRWSNVWSIILHFTVCVSCYLYRKIPSYHCWHFKKNWLLLEIFAHIISQDFTIANISLLD